MAILKILHFPDKRLRLKAIPVEEITPKISDIAENMLETMYAEGGIGLAATQVNIQNRIIVIDISEDKNKPLILINPEILEQNLKRVITPEIPTGIPIFSPQIGSWPLKTMFLSPLGRANRRCSPARFGRGANCRG